MPGQARDLITGLYSGMTRGLHVRPSPFGGTALEYSLDETLHLLLPDGLYRYGMPSQGLGPGIEADRAMLPIRWGIWRAEGDTIVIERAGQTERLSITREGVLTDQDGNEFSVVRQTEAQKIDGVWAREDFREPGAPRLRLDPDGRFMTSGPFTQIVASLFNVADWGACDPNAPTSYGEIDPIWREGVGRYDFSDFALTLDYDDGRMIRIGTIARTADDGAVESLRIGDTHWFVRD